MKKILLVISVLFFLCNSTDITNSGGTVFHENEDLIPIIFVSFFGSEEQLSDCLILCESIRTFAGSFSEAPITVYFPGYLMRLKEKYNVDRSWAVAVNEASWMVLEDVAEPNSIDVGMKLGTGWPSGPCEFADKKGIDNILKILNDAYRKYPIELYKASPFLKEYIRNGWIGKLSGIGFYKY